MTSKSSQILSSGSGSWNHGFTVFNEWMSAIPEEQGSEKGTNVYVNEKQLSVRDSIVGPELQMYDPIFLCT